MSSFCKTILGVVLPILVGCSSPSPLLPVDYGDITYRDEGTNITITGLTVQGSSKSTLEIPSRIEDKPVTTIGKMAFKNASMTSVTIPDSVNTIEAEAFNSAQSLTDVRIGKELTFIGSQAFADTALNSLSILALQAPSISSDFQESFPSLEATLHYPIEGRGYELSPWKDFRHTKPFVDPNIIEKTELGYRSLHLTLRAPVGITITVEAHSTENFQDNPAIAKAASNPEIVGSQELSLTDLSNGVPYYLHFQAENSRDKSEWIEIANNPYTPSLQHAFQVEGVQIGLGTLTLSFKAFSGVDITIAAHTQQDFSDTGISSTITALGGFEEGSISNLIGGMEYYLRVQVETLQGEKSEWIELDFNPYIPHVLYIIDVIPRSGRVSSIVGVREGVEAKIQISEDENFSPIFKEASLIGTSSPQTVEINGLSDGTSYYLRLQLEDDSAADRYSTPFIPTADGMQHIHRLSELAKIGKDDNYPAQWHYDLMSDLDFADADNDGNPNDPYDSDNNRENGNWNPLTIGNYDSNDTYLGGGFSGSFNGGAHSITGMTILSPGKDGVAFFGTLADGGEIKDLSLEEVSVTGGQYVGSLVGHSYKGTISHSHAVGTIIGQNRVGGLVGWNNSGAIDGSHANVDLTASGFVAGGLIGSSSGMITNSYSTGAISGKHHTGGLLGYSSNDKVVNAYATGAVTGVGNNVGGLIGYNYGGEIISSYATGDVFGEGNNVGGFVGYTSMSSMKESYATGNVVGEGSYTGGLIGENSSSITSSYSTGNVTGKQNNTGGLVGYNANGGNIRNAYTTGNVSGAGTIGGLVGINFGNIMNIYRYVNQLIIPINENSYSQTNTIGYTVSLDQLKSPNWYVDILGWTGDRWRLSGLVNGSPPYHPHVCQDGIQTKVPGQPNIPIG